MNKKILISGLLLATVTVFSVAEPKYISPNNDGIQDELVIPMKISDKRYVQGWSLVIMDSNHNVVRTIENKVARPTKMTFKAFFKQLITPKLYELMIDNCMDLLNRLFTTASRKREAITELPTL